MLATLNFSKKKKTQINVYLELNLSNTIKEEKKQLGGAGINKNDSKYIKAIFENFIFNLVRELDMPINAAVAITKLGRQSI